MIAQSVAGGACIIRVDGDLTAAAARELREKVTWAFRNYATVEVDLSAVHVADEVGRGMLALFGSFTSPMFKVIPPSV